MVNIPRRATAFLAGLLILQLTLAGATVRLHVHAVQSSHEMMTIAPSAGGTMASADQQADASCHALAGNDHCTLPGAQDGCDAMTSCISTAFGAPAYERTFVGVTLGGVAAEPALPPPTHARAPELPPPRT
jgi:hypothetical protein